MGERRVHAVMSFLGPCLKKPIFHDRRPDLDYLPLEQHRVRIEDARADSAKYTLDRHGFSLVHRPTAVDDMFDPADRARYLCEIETLVAELTGASKVVALANGVIRRSERAAGYRRDGTTVLGRFAHCDFSPSPAGSDSW